LVTIDIRNAKTQLSKLIDRAAKGEPFIIAKAGNQAREMSREYLEQESHYVWGKRYLLTIVENPGLPSIEIEHSRLMLRVRPRTGVDGAMPQWRVVREQLNRLPVRHDEWADCVRDVPDQRLVEVRSLRRNDPTRALTPRCGAGRGW
jgi:hypothetical protein